MLILIEDGRGIAFEPSPEGEGFEKASRIVIAFPSAPEGG